MIVKVSELPAEGVSLEDASRLGPVYADPSWRLESVRLTIEPDGAEVTVRGRIRASVPLACSRCLEVLPTAVSADLDVRLAPRPTGGDRVELAADDLDVDFYDQDQIDLARIVETETTLALPMKPLCRDDCQGLCPACGGNRNIARCTCPERPPDPRLAPLKDLAARLPR